MKRFISKCRFLFRNYLQSFGIPTEMFTVMFALGRLPGWIAQWKEMMEDNQPIGRPRQIYTGENERDFTPLEKSKFN